MTQTAWKESKVPQDWLDAVLVPIPREGTLANAITGEGLHFLRWLGSLLQELFKRDYRILPKQSLNADSGEAVAAPT